MSRCLMPNIKYATYKIIGNITARCGKPTPLGVGWIAL